MEAERVGFDTQALDVITEVDEETKERYPLDAEERKSGIDDFVRVEIEGDLNIAANSFGSIQTKDHHSSNLVRDSSLLSDNS